MKLIPDRNLNAIEFCIVHKGNFVKLLRSRDIKIGANCQLLNKIENFGS